MNININDKNFEEKELKAVFNGGNSGIVRECTARMTKRGADENPNGPLYKLLFKDNLEAEIDRPFFQPKEDMTGQQSSFFVKELKHVMTQTNTDWDKEDFASYGEMLEYVIGKVKGEVAKHKFGVAVSFGTIKKPDQYLKVDGFWGFRNEENITAAKPLQLSKGALMNRIEPKGPKVNGGSDAGAGAADKDDMPF